MKFKIKKISGDASFREFFRVKKNSKTSVLILAKKDKFKNLITYSTVNKILNSNRILAPRLISNNYKKNIIEITDFGNTSFLEMVRHKKNKIKYYKKLIDIIIKIQKIRLKKNYFLNDRKIRLPNYNLRTLNNEITLFFDWYMKYISKKKINIKFKNLLKKELNNIFQKIFYRSEFFVHRDFHASNVMCYKKKFALIDSQDAVIGYPLYDVASLIDDVRIKLPSNLQSKILNYYMNKCDLKPFDKIKIKTDFEILSVQRNLRILGVFARLYKRDNKHNYLKYLPYTWKLIERRIKSPTFKSLNILIKKIS